MFKWIRSHKIIGIIVIVVLFLMLIVMAPFILNMLYHIVPPCNFFKVDFDASNILEYYGAILTFIGTISLGIITIYQNYVSQRKTDEVNRLTLELQKKSMVMAEENYKNEKQYEANKNTPKFELKNSVCNGYYMNLCATLKNISNFIISGMKSISLEVFDEYNNSMYISYNVKIDAFSLSPGQETRVNFNNSELKLEDKQVYQGLKRVNIVWSFQCEDSYENIHYYKARLYVENSINFTGNLWELKRVG